jgi:hypothetical protein
LTVFMVDNVQLCDSFMMSSFHFKVKELGLWCRKANIALCCGR